MHDQLVGVTTTGKTPELLQCPSPSDNDRISTDWVINRFIPYLMDLRRNVCANAQNFVGQQRKMAITHWLHSCICTTSSPKLRLIANTAMQKHSDEPEAFLLYFAGELECGDKEQLGTTAINNWRGATRMSNCEAAFNQLILLVQMVQVVHLIGINGTIVTACRRFAQQNDVILAIVTANYGNVDFRCPDGTVLSANDRKTPGFMYWMALLADALRSFKRAHGLELECLATRDFGRFSLGARVDNEQREGQSFESRLRRRPSWSESRGTDRFKPDGQRSTIETKQGNELQSQASFKRGREKVGLNQLEIPRKVRQVIGKPNDNPNPMPMKDFYGEPPKAQVAQVDSMTDSKQDSQLMFHNGTYWTPVPTEVCFVHFDSHNQAETLISQSLVPYLRDVQPCSYEVYGFAGDHEYKCEIKGK